MPPANTPSDTPSSLSPTDILPSFAQIEALSFNPASPLAEGSSSRRSVSRRERRALEQQLRRGWRESVRERERDRERDRDREQQAYGQPPGQRQSLYDWAPLPAAEDGRSSFPSYDELLRYSTRHAFRWTLDPIPGQSLPLSSSRSSGEDGGTAQLRPLRPGRARGSLWTDEELERARAQALRLAVGDDGAGGDGGDIVSMRFRFLHGLQAQLLNGRPGDWSGSAAVLPDASKDVERVIDYLSAVRMCRTPEESLRLAISRNDWCELFDQQPKCEDFVLDTSFLKVAETSWLKVGGVFWGSQVAPTALSSSARSSPRGSTSFGSSFSSASSQWSVKVSVSSIEYSQLRLTGTMEAFTDGKTNIKTYFEGEIIDFNKHTFRTLSFSSSLRDDANNWRKLDPFVHLNDADLVKSLTSRKYLMELNAKWLFLRIKEHCFLNPDPDVGGLTISGFYYLSLRREDGRIHGYYYDPQSQPYQELTLMPEKRLFPSYKFR